MEESGQWLENVYRTHLVLASFKLVLQKDSGKYEFSSIQVITDSNLDTRAAGHLENPFCSNFLHSNKTSASMLRMIEPRTKNFHEIVLRSVSRYQIFFHSLPTMTLKFFYRFNQSGFHNFNSASLSISGDNSGQNFDRKWILTRQISSNSPP